MKNISNLIASLKLTKEAYCAMLVFLIISLVYLYPAFLGKVDTPIDIRNVQMYPWRYYAVDKKIKKIVLWEYKSLDKKEPSRNKINEVDFNLKILPDVNNINIFLPVTLTTQVLSKLNKSGECYFSFNLWSDLAYLSNVDLVIYLVDKVTKTDLLKVKATLLPISSNKKDKYGNLYKAYFRLTNIISIKDFNRYDIKLVIGNKSKKTVLALLMKNFQLVYEDFSKIQKIHNYYLDDLIQGFTPARGFYSNSIKRWELPFWNNYILTGCEYLAEHQVGYFHPLYFILYFLFDHFTAHLLITFISFFLCGVGAYFLARYWGLSFIASIFTGIVYMFHPFNVVWFSFEHMLMISATLPFLIISYEKNVNNQRILNKHLLISAVLLGLIFISGHLQHVYYALIFFFLYAFSKFLFFLLLKKGNYFKHIFSIVFIFGVSIMIGAIVTIPLFSLVPNSHRVEWSKDVIKASSINLKVFLGLFFPYYKGYPEWSFSSQATVDWGFAMGYVYFGLIPFLLSLFSLRSLFKNILVIFFFLVITFSILVSTGSELFFLIRDYVPGFKQLQHSRFLQLYSFSVPFLAGIGFQAFLNLLSFLKKRVINTIGFFIILISIIDLIFYSSFFITWSDRKDYKKLYKGGSLEFLIQEQRKTKELFRVLPFTIQTLQGVKLKGNVARPQTLQPYEIEEASGYVSLVSKDLYNLFVYLITKNTKDLYKKEIVKLFPNPNIPYPIYNFKSKVMDLLNIKYFLVPNILALESGDTKRVYRGDCSIYLNKDYLPRAFVVPSYRVVVSSKRTIVELDSEKFDPRREVILMSAPPIIAKQSPNAINSDVKYKINFLKYENNNIILKVEINKASFLVLGHNLNNNWKVKINGKEEKHYQANLIQRAVYLPKKGTYILEFYYYPILFLIGGAISAFGILILIFLALFLKYRKEDLRMEHESKLCKKLEKVEINV